MDIRYPGFCVQDDGTIHSMDGLVHFPEKGIWSADNRILSFFSQPGGSLTSLVFQGDQPQSANAFLLKNQDRALSLSLGVETGTHRFQIKNRFRDVFIRPYGWENTFRARNLDVQCRVCVQGESLIWQVRCRNGLQETIRVVPSLRLNPESLNIQVNGKRTWQYQQYEGGILHLTARDQLQTSTWINSPGFKDIFIDAETHLVVAGERPEDWVGKASVKLSGEEISSGEWGNWRSFFVVCHPDGSRAFERLAVLRSHPDMPFQEQAKRYAARSSARPALRVGGYPAAEAVYRLAPVYVEACKVVGTGALRSSAGGHYFVWGWDNLMAGHEFTYWGDLQAARELLAFVNTHSAQEGCVPHRFDNDLQPLQVTGFDFISQLFISLLYQYYCDTLDRETLLRHFPFARKIFIELASRVDQNGFYHSLGMYPDAPEKLGRTTESLVAYENLFWYCACRMMEILSQAANDPELSLQAKRLETLLEGNSLAAFYDSKAGFLVDALIGPGLEPNGTYPRYSLFPLHNAFGAWLLRPVYQEISRFIEQELVRPDGIRMVPEWDAHTGTETVTGNCWFLHFDLYCLKAFRRAGNIDAIENWLKMAERYYRHRRVIPELQTMVQPGENAENWPGITGQIWQLFALSGWTRGLREGVLGLECDIGGITYIPCPGNREITLQGLPYRGGIWNVMITGEGPWLKSLTVDDTPVLSSCKVPNGFYTPGRHDLKIVRGTQTSNGPWLLEAVGASTGIPQTDGSQLVFELYAHNLVNVVFYSASSPHVLIDGDIIQSDWEVNTCIGTFTIPVNEKVRVSITAAV